MSLTPRCVTKAQHFGVQTRGMLASLAVAQKQWDRANELLEALLYDLLRNGEGLRSSQQEVWEEAVRALAALPGVQRSRVVTRLLRRVPQMPEGMRQHLKSFTD